MIASISYWFVCLFGIVFFWMLPKRFRWIGLFALSFAYLASLTPLGVLFLLVWSIAFYYLSPSLNNNKIIYYALIGGILCYFVFMKSFLPSIIKHSPLEIDLLVTLGLSYYTFKLIHYSIEVRRKTLIEHNIIQYLCYLFFFPIYTAGPIEMFNHFFQHHEEKWSINSTIDGVNRIIYGLIKKFIIVDVVLNIKSIFGASSANIIEKLSAYSFIEVWALLLVTYLTIYLDFSAYSDIAIGTARLFGFTIMENFNWPILATNIVDFWRRWHMTLAGWVQQYVFMPLLGLYRKPVLALFTSFIVLGMWHELSLSRIGWGLCHASAIAIYVKWSRVKKHKKTLSRQSLPEKIGGFVITQLFLILSMAFLVGGEGRELSDCFRIVTKLAGIDVTFD